MTFLSAFRSAIAAFRQAYFSTAPDPVHRDIFSLYEARRARYALYDALYENTAYDSTVFGVHAWAKDWKHQLGLYRYTRGVYNPARRIVEFWACHLMGGALDPAAGDGIAVPSALPIATDADVIRPAVAKLWADSRWQEKKSQWTRTGAKLGDAPLRVAVDEARQLIRLRPFHPRTLVDCTFGDDDDVLGYVIEEIRDDPRRPWNPRSNRQRPPAVAYCEWCRREGDEVTWTTYLNGEPYNWRGADADGRELPPEWSAPLPFVPLVVARHLDDGHDWGLSEYHGAVPKIVEADDLASKLDDQIRVLQDPRWLLAGIRKGDLKDTTGTPEGLEQPQPGRAALKTIFATDPAAKAQALVADMQIAEASAHIATVIESLDKDYPELRYERLLQADPSGTALREARKPVTTKVNERRPGYDSRLVRAQQMALCLGGYLGFPGYEGFGLESWDTPAIAHAIGSRPVFEVEDLDRIEEDTAEATAAGLWTTAGVPLAVALKRAGWDEEAVAEVERHQQQQEQQAAERMARLADHVPPDGVTQ